MVKSVGCLQNKPTKNPKQSAGNCKINKLEKVSTPQPYNALSLLYILATATQSIRSFYYAVLFPGYEYSDTSANEWPS